ncbi:MAG: ATP12 family protein [Alphaproteobacteria bacterium]
MSKSEQDFYKEFNNKLQNDAFKTTAPKKFWHKAEVQEDASNFYILLDNRRLKTPQKKDVCLPNPAAAMQVVQEWQSQQDHIKPRSMPISRLVMTVIDQLQEDENKRQNWLHTSIKFLETDLILFPSPSPKELCLKEQHHWQPLLGWASATLGHDIQPNQGLSIANQAPAIKKLSEKTDSYNIWQQAAFSLLTQSTGSAIIAFAAAENHIDVKKAQQAALIHEYYQQNQWGEDAELTAQICNKEFEIAAFINFLRNI